MVQVYLVVLTVLDKSPVDLLSDGVRLNLASHSVRFFCATQQQRTGGSAARNFCVAVVQVNRKYLAGDTRRLETLRAGIVVMGGVCKARGGVMRAGYIRHSREHHRHADTCGNNL